MIGQLDGDPVYARYRHELPLALPATISYRATTVDDAAILPSTFALDAPIWSLSFTGAGDSMMICYVSGRTGETYVLRAEATASAPQETSDGEETIVRVAEGSTGDRLRIAIATDATDASLFDLAGHRLMVVAGEEMDRGRGIVEFDMRDLPHGEYFCAVRGKGWCRLVGVIR
jgi:hypothetical protein